MEQFFSFYIKFKKWKYCSFFTLLYGLV